MINLFNEIGMLAKIPRSGFAFLGSGSQSVADHSHRMTLIAYVMADLVEEKVDKQKLLLICLFHDLAEARTGDLNYVNKRYLKENTHLINEDIKKASPYGKEIVEYLEEYAQGNSIESKIAHDADKLEMLLVLKEELDLGNPKAIDWIENCVQRLVTETAKKLAEDIRNTPSDAWWRAVVIS